MCPGVEPFLITVDGVDGVVGAGEGGLVGELFVDGGVALSGGVEVVLVGDGVFPKKWRRSLCREFVDVSES